MKKKVSSLLIFLIVFMTVFSGCSTKQSPDKSIIFRCPGGWYLPPAFHGNPFSQGGDGSQTHFVFESLFFFIPKTEELIPRLGTGLEESKDLKTLTIKLRENVLWHDLKPFTSEDIKTNFLVLYLQGWGGNLLGIDTPDKNTVVFHWRQPMTVVEKRNILLEKIKAPDHLYHTWLTKAEKILDKARVINLIDYKLWKDRENKINEAIQIEKSDALQDMYKYRPENPIGTGAFKISNVGASELEMTKFPQYWAAKDVSVDKVKLLRGPSNDVLWAFLIAGDVDVSHPATPEDVANQILKLNNKIKIKTPPDYGEFGFVFNTKKAPMSDINFRKAIAHLINKDIIRMVSSFYSKTADEFNTPIIESLQPNWIDKNFVNSLTRYDYSVDKAVKILEQAGYKKDDYGFYKTPSGEEIKLEIASIAGYSDWVLASESFATQLTKAGIRANVRTLEGSFFHQQLQSNNYDIASNFGADFKMYAHPSISFGRYFDTNGYLKHASGLADKLKDKDGTYINLQNQVDDLVNSKTKEEISKPIEKLSWVSNEYLPFLPIYEKNLTVFAVDGERVTGWPDNNDPIWTSSSSSLESLYSFLIASGRVHSIYTSAPSQEGIKGINSEKDQVK